MQTPPVISPGLDPVHLTLAKENRYFKWVLTISLIAWAVLVITIVGLIYAPFIAFFVWLGNGLIIARLRSEAVRVTERQMPALHANFVAACERLGLREIPALYVTQAGGLLNAFAARHAGRNFVIVFADLLDALGEDSPEMRFVLGHEIGHIKSRHLWKQIFLAPGMFFPLIGPAYRRSWESSCDRFGAFACGNTQASLKAMLVLSAGRKARPIAMPRNLPASTARSAGSLFPCMS